jgi:hypothetical protein
MTLDMETKYVNQKRFTLRVLAKMNLLKLKYINMYLFYFFSITNEIYIISQKYLLLFATHLCRRHHHLEFIYVNQ